MAGYTKQTGLPEIKLPYHFEANNRTIVIKRCPPNRYGEIVKMFQDSAKSADAVGLDEFPTSESLMQKIKSSQLVMLGEDANTKELALFYLLYPTPLSRSEKPIYHAGYQINNPAFRKMGLGMVLYMLVADMVVSNFGYQGILGRIGITGRGIIALMDAGTVFTGIIPRSIRIDEDRLLDDLVVFSSYGAPKENILKDDQSLPELQVSNLTPFDEVSFPSVTLYFGSCQFTLRPGGRNDVRSIEILLRQAAEAGQGFGIDEFKPNGQHNRAFFQKCHSAVLEDSNGSVVATVLFGLSKLTRTTTPETSHVYIIVDDRYRRQGIARTVLEEMSKIIRSLGYKRIITDVYSNNQPAINFCHKVNFLLTAGIPRSGYIKNFGHCSSYVFVDQTNYTLVDFPLPTTCNAKL